MAVALAQPTDVVKIRFQAQTRSNEHTKRYCGTIDAYKTIAKEEGVRGLWKGNSRTWIVCMVSLWLTWFITQVLVQILHAVL